MVETYELTGMVGMVKLLFASCFAALAGMGLLYLFADHPTPRT